MEEFKSHLISKIEKDLFNFHEENYDFHLFGSEIKSRWRFLKKIFRKKLISSSEHKEVILELYGVLSTYYDRLEQVYYLLSDEHSRKTWIDLIAFKVLGHLKVQLDRNDNYFDSIENLKFLATGIEPIQLNYDKYSWTLHYHDLSQIGFPIRIYYDTVGVYTDFVLQQYNYRDIIKAEPNDVIIDAGGCWADTALYFGDQIGNNGKVYSFEFVPGNVEIFKRNQSLNQEISKRIKLCERPLWSSSNKIIYFRDQGPATNISFEKFEDQSGHVKTITLDDFCKEKSIQNVNLIKMDIEGAEINALEGSLLTIKRFKPKLAICKFK